MNYQIITNIPDFDTAIAKWETAEYLATDTETDGLSRFCKIVGASFSINATFGWYLPIRLYNPEKGLYHPWKECNLDYIKCRLSNLLCRRKNLLLHNAPFDARVFANWLGIDIIPFVLCDTALLAHTVHNEAGPHGLKPLATELIDPEASAPQDDVKQSVLAMGGKVTKEQFDMYMCEHTILGRYAAHDTIYTYALFLKLYPEIEKQGLTKLWNEEVMPLLEVSYELNNNGIRVDVPYFEKLKGEIEAEIKVIEDEIFSHLEGKISDYEMLTAKNNVKLTALSQAGKLAVQLGFAEKAGRELIITNQQACDELVLKFYKEKNSLDRVFNLDSPDCKAFLIYDILGIECTKFTKTEKRATDAKTLDAICEENEESSDILKLLMKRSKEIKLLSTYVIPILTNNIDGRIYAEFKQIGTVSGRFSSSGALNLQTLPRDDKRIKKGFIPEDDWYFVAADYAQLEPRSFAHVSGEERLISAFAKVGVDFYSTVAIDLLGIKGASANENDPNYLKKIQPAARQLAKVVALAIPYGITAWKLAKDLKITPDEAQQIIDDYLAIYPKLAKWMKDSEKLAYTRGYVTTLTGRKRRLKLIHKLHKETKITQFTKQNLKKLVERYPHLNTFDDIGKFSYACSNELNNAKNVQTQGLAGSICNAAMIKLHKSFKAHKLQAKIIMMIHDEIVATCPKHEVEIVAQLMQDAMENNDVTAMLSVKMLAEPTITNISLAEAK